MKRFHGFLVAVVATTILCSGALADEPSEKIGGGRLLRKWRDDLFGKSEDKKPKQPTVQDPRHQPTPAQPRADYRPPSTQSGPSRNTPQPAYRKPANVVRSLTQPLQTQPLQQQAGNAVAPARANQHAAKPIPGVRQNAGSIGSGVAIPAPLAAHAPQPAKRNELSADRFGMEINSGKDEKFYIVRVEPRGNAAKAGIQRGDEIVQVGGSNLTSLEEIDQIEKILGAGDQLEFKISRRGQTKDIMIQYGEAPAVPTATESNILAVAPDRSAAADLRSRGGLARAAAGRYDFVPQPSANGYQSVLEMEQSAQESVTAPTRPLQRNQHVDGSVRRPVVDPSLAAPSSQLISHPGESSSRGPSSMLETILELPQNSAPVLPSSPPKHTGSSILEELSLE